MLIAAAVVITVVMASKAARAEAKIAAICAELGITQSGHFWLDHAVDPFKDMIKPHPGFCDKTSAPSVVEVVKQTVNITAPGAGNWDCNIFFDQVLQTVAQNLTTLSNGQYVATGQSGTSYNRGGLVVRKAASGTSLDITQTDNPSCLQLAQGFYAAEDSRVIAAGFEVHDTTQELKKQGSVVCWRVDEPTEQTYPVSVGLDGTGAAACVPTACPTVRLANPPFTQSEALDMVGSAQWEAKEGVYVTPVLASDTNLPMGLRSLCPNTVESTNNYFPPITQNGVAKLCSTAAQSVLNPWSMSGAFFAGLDPAAVLTVNFNMLVERFPNKTSAIRRLCYPSPPWDPKALELYSMISREMPVGVTVEQNGIGDWIAGIANLAAGALSMIPHPIPKMIGAGITALGNNQQVQKGTLQLVKQVEKQIKRRDEPELLLIEPSKEPRVCEIRANGTIKTLSGNGKSNGRTGNYIPPGGVKKGNQRPNRLKKMGASSLGPDNPWARSKAAKKSGNGAQI